MLSSLARKLLPSLALPLLLAACANYPASQIPIPATTELLDKVPIVQQSAKSPCWQQEQIAAQHSYIDSIKSKKEIVYGAPCKEPAKVATASVTKPTAAVKAKNE